jgi:hypothetical protein
VGSVPQCECDGMRVEVKGKLCRILSTFGDWRLEQQAPLPPEPPHWPPPFFFFSFSTWNKIKENQTGLWSYNQHSQWTWELRISYLVAAGLKTVASWKNNSENREEKPTQL